MLCDEFNRFCNSHNAERPVRLAGSGHSFGPFRMTSGILSSVSTLLSSPLRLTTNPKTYESLCTSVSTASHINLWYKFQLHALINDSEHQYNTTPDNTNQLKTDNDKSLICRWPSPLVLLTALQTMTVSHSIVSSHPSTAQYSRVFLIPILMLTTRFPLQALNCLGWDMAV